jgi:hypothetical protein
MPAQHHGRLAQLRVGGGQLRRDVRLFPGPRRRSSLRSRRRRGRRSRSGNCGGMLEQARGEPIYVTVELREVDLLTCDLERDSLGCGVGKPAHDMRSAVAACRRADLAFSSAVHGLQRPSASDALSANWMS